MRSTILLADKSITIQKIVELTFADEDFVIKSVSDGQAALDAIPSVRPDLILADISLPVISGYEICRSLRSDASLSEFSRVPVILLAGIYETMDEERMRQVEEKVKEVGATGFLSKPFDPQLLTLKVREFLPPAESTEAAVKSEEPVVSDMFAQVPAGSEMFSELPGISEAPMEDFEDSERTMMIPRDLPSGENMFAELPPYDQETPAPEEPPRRPVDIDAIKPVNEPVFDGEEPLADTTSEQEQRSVETSGPEPGGFFSGREEQEIDMPLAETAQEEVFTNGPTLILPSAEEPFADVYETPSRSDWTVSPPAEETPFGLTEPPDSELFGANADNWKEPSQTPAVPEEATTQSPYYEDTLPGVDIYAHGGHQPVEELFDGEPSASVTEGINLEAVTSESGPGTDSTTMEESIASQPVEGRGPVEITDELVERIAERVVSKLSDRVVSEIVWQVVPDLAEKMIRRELEKLHAGED